MPPIESPNWNALRLYLSYWRRFPWLTLQSILFSVSLSVRDTIVPLMVALNLAYVLEHHALSAGLLIVTAVLLVLIIIVAYLTDKYGVSVLHNKVQHLLYDDTFKYLAFQDYSFFANRFSGGLVNQASRFAKSYTEFNDILFFNLLPLLTSVIIAISVMIYYSPVIGILTLVIWLFAISQVVRLGLRRLTMRRTAVAKESQLVGELADVITNSLTVKTFAAEEREIKRYAATNIERSNLFLRSWRRAVRNGWVVEINTAVMQMLVLIGGLYALNTGQMDVATFLLFQVYVLRIMYSIQRSGFIVRHIESVAGDAQEMTDLLEQPPLIQDKISAEPSLIKKGVIKLEDVDFQYDDANSQEALFEKFNLEIKAGQKIGLVGPSGGGKTTITRLLLRFMDIQEGSIKIDGQDIRSIRQQDLRRAIAYVPQEPLLFHRTIKENIAYGNPSASDDEIIKVAKKAYAHDFIKDLPKGYETLVGERGVKLSGGQRQRVAIARAMLANAPILILDEATSALDSESERLIQKALWELMKDKTAVVIAHRLSTIQRMDRIIVLDEGKILEQGSHKTLLKKKGLYAKLWSHQSGGFLESN